MKIEDQSGFINTVPKIRYKFLYYSLVSLTIATGCRRLTNHSISRGVYEIQRKCTNKGTDGGGASQTIKNTERERERESERESSGESTDF